MRCPVCPPEVRNLHACAHNLVGAWMRGELSRIPAKFAELSRAVEAMQPLVDAHFAELQSAQRDEHERGPAVACGRPVGFPPAPCRLPAGHAGACEA